MPPTTEKFLEAVRVMVPLANKHGVPLDTVLTPNNISVEKFKEYVRSPEEKPREVAFLLIKKWKEAIQAKQLLMAKTVRTYHQPRKKETPSKVPQVKSQNQVQVETPQVLKQGVKEPPLEKKPPVKQFPPTTKVEIETKIQYQAPLNSIQIQQRPRLITNQECEEITGLSKNEQNEVVAAHNTMRKKYGNVPALVYDDRIADFTQVWANKVALILSNNFSQWLSYKDPNNTIFPHNPNREGYGENIYRTCGGEGCGALPPW
jgi:uncharacterized protein YkwD